MRRLIGRPSRLAGIVGAVLSSPTGVLACPACYASSSTRVLNFYYLSTAMLTLLPFAVVGTLVVVGLHFKRQAALGQEDSGSDDVSGLTEPTASSPV